MSVRIHHKVSAKKPDHKPVIQYSTHSIMDGHVAVKPQLPPANQPVSTFSDYGSKEEVFFDSQAWLDSDCEDEFMSVNGDFTPSRGNTPVHHSLIPSRTNGSMAQPSATPTEKRKRLLDFFKESKRENHGSHEEFAEPPNKYGNEMTSKKDGLRSKSAGFMHGCFTSLLSVHRTGRQKKKSLKSGRSPVVSS
ncbi:hypothetical protein M8C21_015646 [Ambrosia artemisiifolia]|uniref:Uncharacterized protein n=1 Tax=Ambrosia artemisiifolia TaxID=4212 RepID=A0AAD5C782_AMBAR|nr:hypothetical protein M8C21_015646 [Ambrosia artemisiifolia]